MATPRIFVSSTCYDLHEIRHQLRDFILSFGYEPVMSEFEDIFYDYNKHVQDACISEISKCQLFVLVVGNNYGSLYHNDNLEKEIPDSITLREFKKALDMKLYKHIFVNKFVDYDYNNYKRAFEKELLQYFQKNKVDNSAIQSTTKKIKEKFDSKYYFPFPAYKYIFYFLDLIHGQNIGNARTTFESFEDIKTSLRKQWSGFMFESLTSKSYDNSVILKPIENKIERIENHLRELVDSKSNNDGDSLIFDIENLSKRLDLESLEKVQNTIQFSIESLLYYETYREEIFESIRDQRVWFSKQNDSSNIEKWFKYLKR